MATTIIGKIGTVYKNEWSATDATYNRLDEVSYLGSTYRVILPTGFVPVGTLPTNETYFKVSARGVDLTTINGLTQATVSLARSLIIPVSLKKGQAIEYKISDFTTGDNVALTLTRSDNTFLTVSTAVGLDLNSYILLEDFVSARFYNNTADRGYTAYFNLKGVIAETAESKITTDFFSSSKKNPIAITWANAGVYWNTLGVKVANASYDISNPIATSGFNYFGYYGALNSGNTAVVATDSAGNFVSVIEVGRLPFNNNGLSLIVIKTTATYISLSTDNAYKNRTQLFQLKSPVLIKFIDDIEANKTAISSLSESTFNDVTLSETLATGNSLYITSPNLTKGRVIKWELSGMVPGSDIRVFLYRTDNTNIEISRNANSGKYAVLESFNRIRFFNNSNTTGFTGKLTVLSASNSGVTPMVPIKTLILGNSYSQPNTGGGSAWVKAYMAGMPSGSTFFTLAVSSATLKDRQADRVTYPYTSRPVSTANTNNLNTLSCQIEKLKRLMAGTDLDAGEVKAYPTADTYPQVIIIEGGMNDDFDSDSVQATYSAQFSRQFTGVWVKQSSTTAAIGSVYAKTPLVEVNRMCFAGAYRYLVEELSTLFPNAQLFFTTVSRLGYWTYDVNARRSKQAAQQRICAELCGASVIDWNAEGQVNSIVNHPTGSGTEADPFVWDRTVGNVDTNDAMHPNTYGGLKYGGLAAKVVSERFLGLS